MAAPDAVAGRSDDGEPGFPVRGGGAWSGFTKGPPEKAFQAKNPTKMACFQRRIVIGCYGY